MFEHGTRDSAGFSMGGETLTAAEAEAEKMARQAAEAEKAVFLEGRRREMAKEKSEADKITRERSSANLETRAIEIFMTANPSFSWHDAKFLYDSELKKLIAIRRFEAAFFGSPDKQRAMLADVHL